MMGRVDLLEKCVLWRLVCVHCFKSRLRPTTKRLAFSCWLPYLPYLSYKTVLLTIWKETCEETKNGENLDNLWLTIGELLNGLPEFAASSWSGLWGTGAGLSLCMHTRIHFCSYQPIKFTSFFFSWNSCCVWEENNKLVTRSRQTRCKYLNVKKQKNKNSI